jgi:hypothetical protein
MSLAVRRLILPGVAILAVVAQVVRPKPLPSAPSTVAAALARLDWAPYVLPVRDDGDLRAGAYLSPGPLADFPAVRRLNVNRPGDWRGVVRVTPYGTGPPDEELAGWGDHGRVVGPLLLFGDPELVARAAFDLGG